MKPKLVVVGAVGLLIIGAVSGASAQGSAEAVPTYNGDVAPILFDHCAECHRPGQVAPMSLVSYNEARPWARAIKAKVVAREMPPWYADPEYGTFRNPRRLSQEEIDTITVWADGGAPQGDGTAPAVPDFAGGWSHPSGNPPDYIIEMPVEFKVDSQAESPNFSIYQEMPADWTEDKFIEAIQIKPGNMEATHHSSIGVRDLPPGTKLGVGEAWPGGPVISNVPVAINEGVEFNNAVDRSEAEEAGEEARQAATEADVFAVAGTSHLQFYIPGAAFRQFRPGVGKRIRHDKYLVWGLHYNATGKPETDRQQAGFWWHTEPMTHELLSHRIGETHIAESKELMAAAEGSSALRYMRARIPVIPPHDPDWSITAITAFKDDVTVYYLYPHMHLRGKDMTFVATYPDGREEVVLHVPNYDFNWQFQYELAEPLKLPAGSTIKTIGHFDNSVRNRYNPAPDKEVYWAEQSWDEMFNGRIDFSVDKLDLRLEERKPQTTQQQQ